MGVMILPVAMAEAERLRMGTVKWWQGVGLFLLTAGTLLSHYLAAFLLGLYLVIMGVAWVIESVRARKIEWKPILSLAVPALFALLVSMRWYIRVLRYSAAFVSTTVQLPKGTLSLNPAQTDYLRYVLGPNVAYALLGLAVLGVIWALWKEKWRRFGAWTLLIFFFTIPIGITIFSFRSDYYGLVLFIPVAILSSGLLVWFFNFLREKVSAEKLSAAVALIVICAFVGWGGWSNRDAVNDETVLVTKSDVAALDWVKNHTPENARFFVNTTGWGFGMYRGADGGGWLLPTTGRWSLAPTTFYPYGSEEETAELWTDWARRASEITGCDQKFWQLVEEADLDYVYLREGSTGLQTVGLLQCPGLTRLYQGESISVWLIQKPQDL